MDMLLSFRFLDTVGPLISNVSMLRRFQTYPYLLRDVARLTTPAKSRAPRTSLYLDGNENALLH